MSYFKVYYLCLCFFVGILVLPVSADQQINISSITKKELKNVVDGWCREEWKCGQGLTSLEGPIGCCQPCLCTEPCVPGNCCPEVTLHPIIATHCRSQYDMFNMGNVQHSDYPETNFEWLHVVDQCFYSSDFDTVSRCKQPETLTDRVIVSSLDGSVVFKNGHCAKCNGFHAFMEWELFVYPIKSSVTSDIYVEDEESFNQNVVVISKPPYNFIPLMEVHTCSVGRDCDLTKWVMASGNVIETLLHKCYSHSVLPMYYHSSSVFANVFCAACSFGPQIFEWHICIGKKVFSVTDSSFSIILNSNRLKDSSSTGSAHGPFFCLLGEVFNSLTGRCVQLFCPLGHSPVFGRCKELPFFTTNRAIKANFMFTFKTNLLETTADALHLLIIEGIEHGLGDCRLCKIAFFEDIASPKTMFKISIVFLTNSKCIDSQVASIVVEIEKHLKNVSSVQNESQAGTYLSVAFAGEQNTAFNEEVLVVRYAKCKESITFGSQHFCPSIKADHETMEALKKHGIFDQPDATNGTVFICTSELPSLSQGSMGYQNHWLCLLLDLIMFMYTS